MPTPFMKFSIIANVVTGLVLIVLLLVALHYVADIGRIIDSIAPVVPSVITG